MIDKLSYGVCFYPEHWAWKTVVDDIRRIRDCGFNYVRIGEGAWWYFEPEEGKYQFDLFDKVIDECRKAELKVVFGTPTYCGPAWIGNKYPDVYRWDYNRTPLKHGGRQQFSFASPRFNDLAEKIVTALANHYKREKQIIAWQIDNEFNCAKDSSYAPHDTIAFRQWLKNRYRTLDAFNEAWGNRFWSQIYSDWDQIDLPHPTVPVHNPHHLLDETRFISDTVVAFCRRMAGILRGVNPKWPLTHNGLFGSIDGVKLNESLDFFSHDQYPLFSDRWTNFATSLVQTRSLSFPYAVLEQQSGPGSQLTYLLRTPRKGEIRLWAHQSFAHGAKMLSYFCWRTAAFGSELHWHGLVDHDGADNNRVAAAKQVGIEIHRLPKDLWDTPVEKCVAILRDFDNETNDRRIFTYTQAGWEPGYWMTALFKAHIPVDQVWPSSDWDGYRILVAPHLKIIDKPLVDRYTAFVENGGVLVIGAQSGTKDRNLHMRLQKRPTLLRKLAGVEVEDWSSLKTDETREAHLDNGDSVTLIGFIERLRLRGAQTVADWKTDDDLLTNSPAITINSVGRGRVVYIAGHVSESATGALVRYLMSLIGYTDVIDADDDVELVIRAGKKHRYLYLLNHSQSPSFIRALPPGTELLTNTPVEGTWKLPPRDIAIFRCAK